MREVRENSGARAAVATVNRDVLISVFISNLSNRIPKSAMRIAFNACGVVDIFYKIF